MSLQTTGWVMLFLLTGPVWGSEPPRISAVDPLLSPRPQLSRPLSLPDDDRQPSDKIVAELRTKVAPLRAEEIVSVIVTLHDPNQKTGVLGVDLGDAERRSNIAALEHQFVDKANLLGFEQDRALQNFPIVIGSVQVGLLTDLARLPEVESIEGERHYQLQRAEGLELMEADRLLVEFGGWGDGIGVAVIDSGIDWIHPELVGRIAAHGNFTEDGGNGFDVSGHGTSVAGIISGVAAGVAPLSKSWALRVFESDGGARDSWVLAALDSVYANRDEFGGVHVVNMSLGGSIPHSSDCDSSSPSFRTVFGQLLDVGITVFVASGNNGFANGVSHPACHSTVIAVGAVYDANVGPGFFQNCTDLVTSPDRVTCYSNSGDPLDILAPSHCAETPDLGGGYRSCFGGTSAASPYAAGVAAQVLSLRPDTTPAELHSSLISTGRLVIDPSNGLVRGRVRAVEAYLSLADAVGTCSPSPTRLCIDDRPGDKRFAVEVSYQTTAGGGSTGLGTAIPLSELGITKGGLFWFFNSTNPEMLVKVLNGCNLNGNFWVFYAATTNVGLTTIVTDTVTGQVWTETNSDGTAALPAQDIEAFSCS